MPLRTKALALFLTPFLLAGCSGTPEVKKEYSLSLSAEEVAANKIELSIGSNVPGTIEVMASIDLADQAPTDTYIGKSQPVLMTSKQTVMTFDTSDLPSGDYTAEVHLYPLWGLKDNKSKSAGIENAISAIQPIKITGTGESSQSATKKNEGRNWVYENVGSGTVWDPAGWKSRFGDWTQIPTTTMNPAIIKNYYFESLDMTIIVNTLKKEIVSWKTGKQGL